MSRSIAVLVALAAVVALVACAGVAAADEEQLLKHTCTQHLGKAQQPAHQPH
jgi:ABC-type glycerol-3-phosphate transport system substrate-binding protein